MLQLEPCAENRADIQEEKSAECEGDRKSVTAEKNPEADSQPPLTLVRAAGTPGPEQECSRPNHERELIALKGRLKSGECRACDSGAEAQQLEKALPRLHKASVKALVVSVIVNCSVF